MPSSRGTRFFRLSQTDQRAMFAIFAAQAAPKASSMFTSGHCTREVWGQATGAPVYLTSLDPDEYRALLQNLGFKALTFRPEDHNYQGHNI